MTPKYDYTRQKIVDALTAAGEPTDRDDLYKKWRGMVDDAKVDEIEQLKKFDGFTSIDTFGMAFNAALLELIERKLVGTRKDGKVYLPQWVNLGHRSLDDEWTS